MANKLLPQYEYLRTHLPVVARAVVQTLREQLPAYRMLTDVSDTDVVAITESNLRVFVETIGRDREPTEAEIAEVGAYAARRAQEQMPLDALITGVHVGAEVGWRMSVAAVPPTSIADVLEANRHVLRYLRTILPMMVTAYVHEQQAIHGVQRDARLALVNALLSGEPFDAHVARADVHLAAGYQVLRLRTPEPGPVEPMSAHRIARLIQTELDASAGTAVLAAIDQHGGTVLYPAHREADLPALVARIGEVTNQQLIAGLALAEKVTELPEAARLATEIADLAQRLRRGPGTYRLADLLLEYQLSRPGSGLTQLADMLAPLTAHEHLIDALRALLSTGHDRRSAAAELHVHPNTLDYRLRRIATLTGLDPHQADAAELLKAALLATDLLNSAD